MKNCYIHIPFCEKICSYCDFCKMYYNKKFVLEYLEALDREIFDLYKGEKLETIYIGGGTPSCLSLKELDILFHSLGMLERTNNCEITIECNFENTTIEKLDLFKEYGTDSRIGLIASVMMSCTETIFYTMSVYFFSAKVKKTRFTLPGALLATLAGIIASVYLV